MKSESCEIIDSLLPKIEQLSKQKYGSNVLEKVRVGKLFLVYNTIFFR